jgi:hypothetical protein
MSVYSATNTDPEVKITKQETSESVLSQEIPIDKDACHPHYTPTHTDVYCDCGMATVGEDRLREMARDGQMVLVSYIRDIEDLHCEMVDPRAGVLALPAYTAISHVRAEGLGNTCASSLPWCRVRQLQTLVDRLHSQKASPSTQPAPHVFWIDTLCLPSSRPFRRQARSSIYRTFSYAEAVLVIEPDFMMRTLASAPTSSMLSTYLDLIQQSSWLKRVWTLQEGAVARLLLFQFADGVLEIGRLLGQSDEYREPSSHRTLAQIYGLTQDVRAVNYKLLQSDIQFDGSKNQLKWKLLAIVRVCYLALLPRFERFATPYEKNCASKIRLALMRDYENDNGVENSLDRDPEGSLQRLTRLWWDLHSFHELRTSSS